ncbi:MAG: D-tyrosyl-tRNA(Tyr) deacylase [Spirochaetes bacterium]|nr:D-tyrosyl-tRNA(Tyr) deacylase [Spirochaetota bacterium]
MRAVVQLVKNASVLIDNEIYSSINKGFLILLGISINDKKTDIDYIVNKIINLRVFKDNEGKLNESIDSISGEMLIISQFTLLGDARKGRRPSYIEAAKGNDAELIYNNFVNKIKDWYYSDKIFTGIFGAMMEVALINDGPVTILLDSEKNF